MAHPLSLSAPVDLLREQNVGEQYSCASPQNSSNTQFTDSKNTPVVKLWPAHWPRHRIIIEWWNYVTLQHMKQLLQSTKPLSVTQFHYRQVEFWCWLVKKSLLSTTKSTISGSSRMFFIELRCCCVRKQYTKPINITKSYTLFQFHNPQWVFNLQLTSRGLHNRPKGDIHNTCNSQSCVSSQSFFWRCLPTGVKFETQGGDNNCM